VTTSPWPKPDRASVEEFYGRHRLGLDGMPSTSWQLENLTLLRTPFPLRLAWEPVTTVSRVRVHRRCADSLGRILVALLRAYGTAAAVTAARVDLFGGVYQFRRISGSSSLSLHSWGAAIDIDPERNGLGAKGSIPAAVVKAFKDEGWAWGGEFKGRKDPMHFEAVDRS